MHISLKQGEGLKTTQGRHAEDTAEREPTPRTAYKPRFSGGKECRIIPPGLSIKYETPDEPDQRAEMQSGRPKISILL